MHMFNIQNLVPKHFQSVQQHLPQINTPKDFNLWHVISDLWPKDIQQATLNWISGIGLILSFIIGYLLFSRGKKLFRVWMGLSGALVGLNAGRLLLQLYPVKADHQLLVTGALILVGAGLFVSLIKNVITLAGFAAGVALAWPFIQPYFQQQYALITLLLFGIIGATLAKWATKQFICIATALTGSWLMLNVVFVGLSQIWVQQPLYLTDSTKPFWFLAPLVLMTYMCYCRQRSGKYFRLKR